MTYPYSPPPPPPGPQPLVSCPVAKAGFYVELQARRDKWAELRDNYLYFYARTVQPVYAEYVENVPADYYSACHQRARDAAAHGEAWLAARDAEFLGTPPSADNGTLGNTKRLIDELDCSWPLYQWMNHVANCQYALDQLQARLAAAETELQGFQSQWNQLYQDCPVPRTDP